MGAANIPRVRKGHEYEQILLLFEKLHRDVRLLENVVVQHLNRGGSPVTWDRIGEVVGLGDEGARKHYTKSDDNQPRRRKKKT